jgi:glucose uptake protein
MPATLYALITVLAWGSWLAPSQNIQFKNQQIKIFYVAVANLILALIVTLAMGFVRSSFANFWYPFLGGVIWAVSGLFAFTATNKIGIAKAFGIWAPLNIIVSLLWGAILFNEFPNIGPLNGILLFISVTIILVGVLLIIFSRGDGEKVQENKSMLIGLSGAVGAGILWGSYFIPIKVIDGSMWSAALPLAAGIFSGSAVLALLTRRPFHLEERIDYLRVGLTGTLWGIGNYGMLLLVDQIGAGRGFTIAQLSIVVNALIGIYWLKDPKPKTRAASFTLIGCVLATLGGILLGNLN